jgi:hypothetical protein
MSCKLVLTSMCGHRQVPVTRACVHPRCTARGSVSSGEKAAIATRSACTGARNGATGVHSPGQPASTTQQLTRASGLPNSRRSATASGSKGSPARKSSCHLASVRGVRPPWPLAPLTHSSQHVQKGHMQHTRTGHPGRLRNGARHGQPTCRHPQGSGVSPCKQPKGGSSGQVAALAGHELQAAARQRVGGTCRAAPQHQPSRGGELQLGQVVRRSHHILTAGCFALALRCTVPSGAQLAATPAQSAQPLQQGSIGGAAAPITDRTWAMASTTPTSSSGKSNGLKLGCCTAP